MNPISIHALHFGQSRRPSDIARSLYSSVQSLLPADVGIATSHKRHRAPWEQVLRGCDLSTGHVRARGGDASLHKVAKWIDCGDLCWAAKPTNLSIRVRKKVWAAIKSAAMRC